MANILASSLPVGLPAPVFRDVSIAGRQILFTLNTTGIPNGPFTLVETTLTKINGTSVLDDPSVINNDDYPNNFYINSGEELIDSSGNIKVFYYFETIQEGDQFEITWKLSNWVGSDGLPITYGPSSSPLTFTIAVPTHTPSIVVGYTTLETIGFLCDTVGAYTLSSNIPLSAEAIITPGTSILSGPNTINTNDNPQRISIDPNSGIIEFEFNFNALFQGDSIQVSCAISSSPLGGTIVYEPPSTLTFTVLTPGKTGGKQLIATNITNTSITVSMLSNSNTGFGSATFYIDGPLGTGETTTTYQFDSTTKDASGNYTYTFTGLTTNSLYIIDCGLNYLLPGSFIEYDRGRLLLFTSPHSNIPAPIGIPPIPKLSYHKNSTTISIPSAPGSVQGPISGVGLYIFPENRNPDGTAEGNGGQSFIVSADPSGNYVQTLDGLLNLSDYNYGLHYWYFNLLDESIIQNHGNYIYSNYGMINAPILLTGKRGNDPPAPNIISYTNTSLTVSAVPDVFPEYVSLVASATISITGTSTITQTSTTKDTSGNYTTTFTGLTGLNGIPYTINYYLNFTDGGRGFDSTPASFKFPPNAPSTPICFELDTLLQEFICNSSTAINGPFTSYRLKITKGGVDTITTRSGNDLFNSSGNTSVNTTLSLNIGDQLQISGALSNTSLGTTPTYGPYSAPLNITVSSLPYGQPFMSLISNTSTSITVSLSQRVIYGTYTGASFFIAPGSIQRDNVRDIYTNTPQLSTPDASGNYLTTFTGLTTNSLYTIFGAFYNVNPTIVRTYELGYFYTAPGINITGTPPAPTIMNIQLLITAPPGGSTSISISVPTISGANSAKLFVSQVDSSGNTSTETADTTNNTTNNVITMDYLDYGLRENVQYILLSYRYTNSNVFGPISNATRINILSGIPPNEIVTSYTNTSLTLSASRVGVTGTITSAVFRLTNGQSYSDQSTTTLDASGNYVTTFTGLSPATQYNILHYFIFNNGIGVFSDGQNINTAPSAPPAPTLVTATTNTLAVRVTTTQTVTGVNFSLTSASGGTTITRAGVSGGSNQYTYTFTGLSIYTFYNITCVASSGTSVSAVSPVLNTRTLAGPPSTPSAPSLNMNIAAPQSQGSISVMGLVSGIANPPFTSAQFIIAPVNTAVTPVPAVTTKAGFLSQDQTYYYCSFTGLEPGSQYLVSWNVTNVSATSPTSATATIQTAPSAGASLTWPNINVSTDAYGLFVKWGNARTSPTEYISYTITVSDALTGGGIYTATSGTTYATQPFYIAQSDINFIYGAMRLNQRILAATTPVAPVNTYYVTVSVSGTVVGTPITSTPFTTIYRSPYSCFKTGTKILCLTEGLKEEYVPIENVRKGTIVKTLKQSYVRVNVIGKSIIDNPDNDDRGPNRLFKLTKDNYPELTEDLIMTGCHSILVDELSAEQERIQMKLMGTLYLTTDKYRLLTFVDEKAEPYISPGEHEIWHLALDNDNYVCNYGIYANGLLVETASIKNMKELSKMTLVD